MKHPVEVFDYARSTIFNNCFYVRNAISSLNEVG
jgi:hypothetical protein